MINSFFDLVQNPVPGPLDAAFHVLLLCTENAGAMNPLTVLESSAHVDPNGHRSLANGFYTDIPPQLTGSVEEVAHTIEVAVRRSYDFMKCPIILGGDRSIVEPVLRGVQGQIGCFVVARDPRDLVGTTEPVLFHFDADDNSEPFPAEEFPVNRVAAILFTGTAKTNPEKVVNQILKLCDTLRV